MTPPLEIFVPGKPSGKARPDQARDGHRFADRQSKAHERVIGQYAMIALTGRKRFTGAVRVAIEARVQGARTSKPDSDNIAKLVLDGLNGVAWHDDAGVVDLHVIKISSREPGLKIRVEEA